MRYILIFVTVFGDTCYTEEQLSLLNYLNTTTYSLFECCDYDIDNKTNTKTTTIPLTQNPPQMLSRTKKFFGKNESL